MTETRTLYDRLGGTPGIEAIVDAVVAAHAENPTIKARFLPFLAEPARLSVIKRHTVQFFELGSGGPSRYEGRSMRDAHRGMNVSGEEYLAAIDDILQVLRARSIDEQTQNDVLAIAFSLKGEILRQ